MKLEGYKCDCCGQERTQHTENLIFGIDHSSNEFGPCITVVPVYNSSLHYCRSCVIKYLKIQSEALDAWIKEWEKHK